MNFTYTLTKTKCSPALLVCMKNTQHPTTFDHQIRNTCSKTSVSPSSVSELRSRAPALQDASAALRDASRRSERRDASAGTRLGMETVTVHLFLYRAPCSLSFALLGPPSHCLTPCFSPLRPCGPRPGEEALAVQHFREPRMKW